MFELKTKRLLLRDFHKGDLAAYQKAGSHPEVLTYYPHDADEWQTLSAELVDTFIESSLETPRLKYSLAIVADGSWVGVVSVRTDSAENRQGSIGCQVAYEHWSKGYAVEAMQAAIALGFDRLDLHRIEAETISENTRAIRLAQRIGMQAEGELRENQFFKDKWWNTTLLGILRSEWDNSSS